MKKNQLLALLLAAVMLLAVLTGCAAKTKPAQEEPAQSETAPETEHLPPQKKNRLPQRNRKQRTPPPPLP